MLFNVPVCSYIIIAKNHLPGYIIMAANCNEHFSFSEIVDLLYKCDKEIFDGWHGSNVS